MRQVLIGLITLLLVQIAVPPFDSGKASEFDVSYETWSPASIQMVRKASKNVRTSAGQNEPTISAPNVVQSGPPAAKEQRLDSPSAEKSPTWRPGEPAKIMPDLKKSRRSEDPK